MGSYSPSLLARLLESSIREEFDDVRDSIMEIDSPKITFTKSKSLKYEGNQLFRKQAYRMAIHNYDKSF